jgi:uncharacterized membrane protein YqjE
MSGYHTTPIVIDREEAQRAETIASAKRLLSAAVKYGEARGKLLALEAKVAARGLKAGLIMYGAAAVCAIAAAAVLIAAMVAGLTALLPHANGALACATVLLGGAAFLLLRLGRQRLRAQNLFPATRTELESDKQWLKNL